MGKVRWLFGWGSLAGVCIIQVFVSFGCATIREQLRTETPYERNLRMERENYGDPPAKGYQPLDPQPILVKDRDGYDLGDASDRNKVLLRALPSEAVRLVIGQADIAGNIQFGSFTAKTKIGNYVVVLDYIKYESRSLRIKVTEKLPEDLEEPLENESKGEYKKRKSQYFDSTPYWVRPYTYEVLEGKESDSSSLDPMVYIHNIPVYVGVGVRMMASVTVNEKNVDLGSLYGLGVGAQSKKLQGTLIIQTLGLSGENISPHIPLPSEINITTIQNAIQALATIKSKLYEANVSLVPVVLASDDNIGRWGSKDCIVSALRENEDALMLKVAPPKK